MGITLPHYHSTFPLSWSFDWVDRRDLQVGGKIMVLYFTWKFPRRRQAGCGADGRIFGQKNFARRELLALAQGVGSFWHRLPANLDFLEIEMDVDKTAFLDSHHAFSEGSWRRIFLGPSLSLSLLPPLGLSICVSPRPKYSRSLSQRRCFLPQPPLMARTFHYDSGSLKELWWWGQTAVFGISGERIHLGLTVGPKLTSEGKRGRGLVEIVGKLSTINRSRHGIDVVSIVTSQCPWNFVSNALFKWAEEMWNKTRPVCSNCENVAVLEEEFHVCSAKKSSQCFCLCR